MKTLAWGLLMLLLATAAGAVSLTLDGVTQQGPKGEVPLRVDSRARFDFDPATGTLVASGTWTAESVVGPNRLTRFSHKVEDLRVAADGRLTLKSYECVEGTLGPMLGANVCGNYRFGPNGLDDGGVADDVAAGPPKTLDAYRVAGRDWDGEHLVLALANDGYADGDVLPEYGLRLEFSRAPVARQQIPVDGFESAGEARGIRQH